MLPLTSWVTRSAIRRTLEVMTSLICRYITFCLERCVFRGLLSGIMVLLAMRITSILTGQMPLTVADKTCNWFIRQTYYTYIKYEAIQSVTYWYSPSILHALTSSKSAMLQSPFGGYSGFATRFKKLDWFDRVYHVVDLAAKMAIFGEYFCLQIEDVLSFWNGLTCIILSLMNNLA